MKSRPIRRESRGFTLVELLVVISIIIVLAAMSLGGIQIASKRAKAVQSLTDAQALQTAIEAFYSEYSRLPNVGMQGDELQTEGPAGTEFLLILLGKEEKSGEMQNPRQIPFLNARETKIKNKGGLYYGRSGGSAPEGFYDAYGNPFNVRFDDDYDDEIRDPINQNKVIRDKVAIVYSFGPDGVIGDGDEVTTW